MSRVGSSQWRDHPDIESSIACHLMIESGAPARVGHGYNLSAVWLRCRNALFLVAAQIFGSYTTSALATETGLRNRSLPGPFEPRLDDSPAR